MMRRFTVVPVALVLLAPAARAATWEIDPAHTSVQFSVRHMMVSNVRGEFDKVAGTAKTDDTDLTTSTLEATIEAASIVEGPTQTVKDPMGNLRAGAHATTTLKRSDFGIVWNKPLETGGLVLGDDIPVSIDVEAMQKKD